MDLEEDLKKIILRTQILQPFYPFIILTVINDTNYKYMCSSCYENL